jgi:hypothetical protein
MTMTSKLLGSTLAAHVGAFDADAFAQTLNMAAAQVLLLRAPADRRSSLARLTALCRLDQRVAGFLPPAVAAQIGPLGPTRPHAVNSVALVREAFVHAVLNLELRHGMARSEGAINRDMAKIELEASTLLTDHYRAAGKNEKIRIAPAPVSAQTIQRWLKAYEADLAFGLYDKPRGGARLARHRHVDSLEPLPKNYVENKKPVPTHSYMTRFLS